MTVPEPPSPFEAQLAATPEALEAVYRLRYDVFIRELGKGFLRDVDHARGRVEDPEDVQPGVYVFHAGPVEAMAGTLRVQVWEPGRVPEEAARRYSLHRFPGIERHRVCEVARLVVRPGCRGREVVSALARAAFDHVASRHDVVACFLYCAPGLVHAFSRIGFRPYPGDVVPNEDGIRLPMCMVGADLPHLEAVGSPLAPLMKRLLATRGALPDLGAFAPVTRALRAHYETDPGRVWREVRERLEPGPGTCSALLEGLSVAQAERLCRCGFVMDVPAQRVVMRRGLVERELYLVLDGRYEVLMGERRLTVLGRGDVLGEVSFFTDPGERVATVRALAPGRVMVLDRHFLERLIPAHADVACRVLLNLGRIVSRHLATALEVCPAQP